MKKSIICIALATTLGACTTNEKMESRLLANMDTTYAAGTDFFEYATGGWRKANPITDEYARYGQFDALRENNREQLKELVLEQAQKKSKPGSNAQKVGDLYNMEPPAAAAKSLSVLSDSVRPHRQQPTRRPCPWDSQGKNTGVGCHFLLQCMKVKVKSLSRVRLLATPWTAAHQAPPSMGFSRQEY